MPINASPSYLPDEVQKPAGCCQSFCKELNPFQPWWLVKDSSGYKIDIPESFAPSAPMTLLGKVITTGVSLATLFVGLLETPNLSFFFAYFSQISLLLTIIYLLLSLVISVFPSRIKQPRQHVRGLVRLTWIFFVAGVHGQFMSSILYWVTVYIPKETQMTFYSAASHGGVLVLALIDGLVLNRIPLRLMHWWGFIFPLQTLYLVWTVVHWILEIGNPNVQDEDPETNDDAIYSVLAWGEDEWLKSTILSVLVIFVVGPIVYLYMWCLARYPYVCCTSSSRLYFLDGSHRTAASKRRLSSKDEAAGRYFLWK